MEFSYGPDNHQKGALSFKGRRNSYVFISNNGCLDTRYSMTIIFWIYPVGLGPVIHFNPKGRGVDIDIGSGFRLYARFRSRSGNFVKVLYKKIKPRQWNYVAASYDYRLGIATLWRDSRPSVQRRIGRFGLATKYSILIGQKPGYTRHFQGKITCLQIYNFAMTGEQIRSKKKWCFRQGTHSNPIYTSIDLYI